MIPPPIKLPNEINSIPYNTPAALVAAFNREELRSDNEEVNRAILSDLVIDAIKKIETFYIKSNLPRYINTCDLVHRYVPLDVMFVLKHADYFLDSANKVDVLIYIILYLSGEYDFIKKHVKNTFKNLDELNEEIDIIRKKIRALVKYSMQGKKRKTKRGSRRRLK
jgi:hypothetical protein